MDEGSLVVPIFDFSSNVSGRPFVALINQAEM